MAKGEKTGGRKKGSLNVTSRSMKETVISTLEWLQSQPRSNMRAWAYENPTQFYQIAAKLIPTEVSASVEISGVKQIIIEPASKSKGQ
jgi:hypothetical protein